MPTPESRTSALAPLTDRLPAVAAVSMFLWVAGEFAFRRGLVPHLADPLDSGLGADMVAIAIGMPLLAGSIAWLGIQAGITRRDWEYDISLHAIGAGLGGFVGYLALYFGVVLVLVLGFGLDPSTGPVTLNFGSTPDWALAMLLLVNGILVPITEELAWRGVIQTALTKRYGDAIAIVATAIPFVLKHLVVDMSAPIFRVASLVILAFILSILRARYGTASSTVAHLSANGIFTALAVFS